MTAFELNFGLHARQGAAYQSLATEILYGGAAGGGKSHLIRVAGVSWCVEIPGLQAYLFRRISDDLVKNHVEGPKGLRAMLAPFTQAKLVDVLETEIRFWNGSKIYLCHCKDEKDRFKYLGSEIHLLLIDELTTFTETIYRFLRGRVRAVGLNVPIKFEGLFPRILCGSNPGGIGHHFVKEAWQPHQPALRMKLRQMPDEEGGMLRQYIPAMLADNPSMAEDDPGYRSRLRGLGSPALVRAMEDGDWNVVSGAFFPEFSEARHVIAPIEIPDHWMRYRAADWGSSSPFCVLWIAVSDGSIPEIPRECLVVYREWYGGSRPNVGIRLTAEEVADGILEREAEKIDMSVLDPAAFARDGGPSIAERMAARRVHFHPADNSRVGKRGAMGGWDIVRQRLKGQDEKAMLLIFSTCQHLIRTVPALQHDEQRPEDLNTNSDDHAADALRYGCLARPWVRAAEKRDPVRFPVQAEGTRVAEIIAERARLRRGNEW